MLLSLALLIFSLLPQTAPAEPDLTLPEHARLAFEVEGRGVQIYTCMQQGVAHEWVFKAPEATLFDASGKQIGTHGAGPSWTATDGSSITGKVIQKRISPDPLSVPWLLLAATPAAGHGGVMAKVAFVRRWDTDGGVAPADGCDATHAGALARVPYTARYSFYKAEK